MKGAVGDRKAGGTWAFRARDSVSGCHRLV